MRFRQEHGSDVLTAGAVRRARAYTGRRYDRNVLQAYGSWQGRTGPSDRSTFNHAASPRAVCQQSTLTFEYNRITESLQ